MKGRHFAWIAILAGAALASQVALAAGPFSPYGGSWRGAGRLDANGRSEPLRCRSDNAPSRLGTEIALSLTCASDSFRVDIRSDLNADGENVQGTWTETTQNVSGTVAGTLSKRQIDAAVSGSGFNANVVIRVAGRRLDFSLASQLGNVQVVLRR